MLYLFNGHYNKYYKYIAYYKQMVGYTIDNACFIIAAFTVHSKKWSVKINGKIDGPVRFYLLK